ncbi:HlyD family secretion protein [Sedimentibacter acidaminivorans]|uniref:HlyD family secretion protein n=1 Tax=Sedimentibacter acidaminivorans TaxID=913099 RepID=A0ABS4GGW5_9FIRM|nr:efflux RND transporter periplasmic adaptor subunit [Sedimentibacter acidaminivorans]MBP1926933.1 HlyD family secretion protein [Sedimentibacter acidaminivorans]
MEIKKINIKKYINKNWVSKNIKKIVIALVVIVSALGITIGSTKIYGGNMESGIIQGIVSAKDVSVNTKIPGRIVEFYVEEGQQVKAGDPIVEISSEELQAKKAQLEAQIAQAQAGVDASQAVVDMAEGAYQVALERVEQAGAGVKASESQRDMASAVNEKAENGARTQEVAQAESAYNLWKSTYDRAVVLYDGGAISKQKLEEIKTQMDVSQQTLNMAKEGARTEDKKAASAQLSLAEAGILSSKSLLAQVNEASNIALAQVNQANAGLVAAQGKLDQAKAGLQEVEVYLKDTVIKSPIDGTVTTINSDEGELVSTGTSIGTVSNLENCWINVNLDEDKLGGIKEGQIVNVSLLAFKEKTFEGTIVTINKEPDFAVKKATNENGNFDIVSFGVKIVLNNLDESIRPGMTAVVDFTN